MSEEQQSLTASGRPVAPTRIDLTRLRQQRYQKAQQRLRERFEQGQPLPRFRLPS